MVEGDSNRFWVNGKNHLCRVIGWKTCLQCRWHEKSFQIKS